MSQWMGGYQETSETVERKEEVKAQNLPLFAVSKQLASTTNQKRGRTP
jgi:hypothetical protein